MNKLLLNRVFIVLVLFLSGTELIYSQADTIKAAQYVLQAKELFKKQQFESSINLYEKGINLYRAAHAWDKLVETEISVGQRLLSMSKYGRAQGFFVDAVKISISKFGPSHPTTAEAYNKLGLFYYQNQEFDQSILTLRKAMELMEKLHGPNSTKVAWTYNSLGAAYGRKKDFEKQLFYQTKALNLRMSDLATKPGDPSLVDAAASNLNNLALYYKETKQFDKQLEYLQKALNVFATIKTEDIAVKEKLATFYNNISSYYSQMKDYDNELTYLQKSMDVRLKLFGEQSLNITKTYENIGWCYMRRKEPVKALEYFQKGLMLRLETLGLNHPDVALSYTSIAKYYREQSDYEQALDYAQNAFKGLVIGFDNDNPRINPKIKNVDLSLRLLELLELKAYLWEKVAQKNGKLEDLKLANNTYNLALDALDSLRYSYSASLGLKTDMVQTSMSTFEGAIRTGKLLHEKTKQADYIDKAFLAAERGKAFLLLEALRELDAKELGGLPDSLLAQENDLKMKIIQKGKAVYLKELSGNTSGIDTLRQQLLSARDMHEALLVKMEKEYPRYFSLKYDSKVLSAKDIQSDLLSRNDLFIEYFVGDSAVYMFSVDKSEGLKCISTEEIPALQKNLMVLRKSLTEYSSIADNQQDNYEKFVSSASTLYDILLKPILDGKEHKRLVIVPDGALAIVPFEVFLKSKPNGKNGSSTVEFSTLDYLINERTVSYAYSGTLLAHNLGQKTQNLKDARCLAFAPSTFEQSDTRSGPEKGKSFSELATQKALPGTMQEIKAISENLDGTFYYGQDATKDKLAKDGYDYGIIHLAMHGKANDANPMYSSLGFASDSTNTDYLYAHEITGLRLSARLVVLSACETGLGKLVRGEGAMSLARSFMYAGVPSVVMTLWKVNDNSSAKLMSLFYKGLSEGEPVDESLRNAKLEYLRTQPKSSTHPAFWAGFVCVGDTHSTGGTPWWPFALGGLGLAAGAGAWYYKQKKS